MFTDTTILSTAWLDQPALGQRPGGTLLIGAATLTVRHRFKAWSFDLQADSTTVGDDRSHTIAWLGERLTPAPERLLLWRAEDIVVPSLIAATDNARNTIAAARLLIQLERAYTGDVVDVADAYGGTKAVSFDEVAHGHGLEFVPMTQADLGAAHATGNHGNIRLHLAARAKAIWRLWLTAQKDVEVVSAATDAWLASPDAALRL